MPIQKCVSCGWCCKLFIVNLTEAEYKSKSYKTMFDQFLTDFNEAEMRGANLVAKKDDESCVYLDENNKCKIYNKRPNVCRDFFCHSKEEKFSEMIEKIKKKRSEPV